MAKQETVFVQKLLKSKRKCGPRLGKALDAKRKGVTSTEMTQLVVHYLPDFSRSCGKSTENLSEHEVSYLRQWILDFHGLKLTPRQT